MQRRRCSNLTLLLEHAPVQVVAGAAGRQRRAGQTGWQVRPAFQHVCAASGYSLKVLAPPAGHPPPSPLLVVLCTRGPEKSPAPKRNPVLQPPKLSFIDQ